MQILKPTYLHPGDTIGVVALSDSLLVVHHAPHERGERVLRELGFQVKAGRTNRACCELW